MRGKFSRGGHDCHRDWVFLTISAERWASVYPRALPSVVMSREGPFVLQALLLGILGGVGVTLVGCWDMIRQDVL